MGTAPFCRNIRQFTTINSRCKLRVHIWWANDYVRYKNDSRKVCKLSHQ